MNTMAAPNKQPAGSRPGPNSPNEHEPFKGSAGGAGKAPDAHVLGETNLAAHGAPKPVSKGNKNVLH
jgi:hypothetical protein